MSLIFAEELCAIKMKNIAIQQTITHEEDL